MTPLVVKRLKRAKAISLKDIGARLEAEIPAVPVAHINWPQHPYCPVVSFRIGHVQTEIWLAFAVSEARIRALETRTQGEVYRDSCVEFFVSFDRAHYYNFEVNCIGTPHFAYGPDRHTRTLLSLPLMAQIETQSSLGKQPFDEKAGGFEWSLTARIPVACFAHDAIASLSGMRATANFYKIGSSLSVPHFLTWNPVRTAEPDYHRPEFFGATLFE